MGQDPENVSYQRRPATVAVNDEAPTRWAKTTADRRAFLLMGGRGASMHACKHAPYSSFKDGRMSNFASFRRRRIDGVLQRFGISDDALLEALIEAADEIRAFQIDNEPRNSNRADKTIRLLHEITGRWVPEEATAGVLAMVRKLGEAATEQNFRQAWADWNVKGRDPKDWRWVLWAAHVGKTAQKQPQAQQAPAGFSGLQEWLNARQ